MEDGYGFDALIEAFTIFKKYDDVENPTHCEHDTMYVLVSPDAVSAKDKKRLKALGFIESHENGQRLFLSFRFGSG